MSLRCYAGVVNAKWVPMFIRIFSGILILLGGVGFTLPHELGKVLTGLKNDHEIELRLSDIEDVALTDDGHLVFALAYAGRLQVYSPSGEFRRSFGVDAKGGGFCLKIKDDLIRVEIGRGRTTSHYTIDGTLIAADVGADEPREPFGCSPSPGIQDWKGSFSRVEVMLAEGEEPVTIRRRPWHHIARGPGGAWLMAMIGLFLFPEWRNAVFAMFRERLSLFYR